MKITIFIFLLCFSIIACNNTSEFKPERLAEKACECFIQQNVGTIDERLDPCLTNPINENFKLIHKQYYSSEQSEIAIQKYMLDATVLMIRNCDKFSSEMDYMYTNFYSEVKQKEVKDELSTLQDSIINNSHVDSVKIRLLHKRIALLTRSRNFDEATKDIEILEKKYDQKSETYFVRVYIHRYKGNYDAAISEIDKAMASGENEDYLIFKELLEKRKTAGNKS